MYYQDWQIQQLGIIQWILRRPEVFKKKVIISIPRHIRLLIIAKAKINLNILFIKDIMRTLHLTSDNIIQLTPDLISGLICDYRCNSWQLGVREKVMINGSHIFSPSLNELITNPSAKRDLWEQICKYKCDFLS